MNQKKRTYFVSTALLALGIFACQTYYFRSTYTEANALIHNTENLAEKPFLKAHFSNGDVCILRDSWALDSATMMLTGTGSMYDFNRKVSFVGDVSVPLDSVALFETNVKIKDPEKSRIAALAILTGINVAAGIICIISPKTCYGSCPTFYINSDDDFHYSDAEGFSNAILPSMEYADIDALNIAHLTKDSFSITMKNEALETHCVNDLAIYAFPRKEGARIYHTPQDKFYLCEGAYEPTTAEVDGDDISHLLRRQDAVEWFSSASPDDLNSKEVIYLTFNELDQDKDLGLLLHFRQTLMTTFLFYSAMGYMGDEVGDIFTLLETSPVLKTRFDATTQLLGGIDIFIWDLQEKKWIEQSGFNETGPIAINKQMIPFDNTITGSTAKVKIVLNRGLWRLDYAALTHIKLPVEPMVIRPSKVWRRGQRDERALHLIRDPDQRLITMPGSEYTFTFELPESSPDYEVFLMSKGYYLEWMRDNWLQDKNLIKLQQMVFEPQQFLRSVAGEYKSYENEMEASFWNSRIDTKSHLYDTD